MEKLFGILFVFGLASASIHSAEHTVVREPDGLKVVNTEKAPLFTKLGLKKGDLITSVNGIRIRTPGDWEAIHESMSSSSKITMVVKRGGKEKVLNYKVE